MVNIFVSNIIIVPRSRDETEWHKAVAFCHSPEIAKISSQAVFALY